MSPDECPDCVAVGEDPPQFREGRSPVCYWHQKARRLHAQQQRTAASRAKLRGHKPEETHAYVPESLDEITRSGRDRRITLADAEYLDDLAGAVRRSQVDLTTAVTERTMPNRESMIALNRDLATLLTELNTYLWPDGPPPARKRRRLNPRYRFSRSP